MSTQLQIGFADYYERHAESYIEKRDSGLLYFNNAIEIPAVIKELDLRVGNYQDTQFLDVGSGLGFYSARLAKAGATVCAIDISPSMVEMTKEACAGLNVECYNEDFFEHTPRLGIKYDFIVAGFMLGYFEDLDNAFTKLRQLSKRGSVVLISSIHPFKTPFSGTGRASSPQPYFNRRHYKSDFLNSDEPIDLMRWIPEEVTAAASEAKFVVEKILEPKPAISYSDYGTKELFDHYSKYPSAIIYVMRRS